MKILLVDDNSLNLKQLQLIFKPYGVTFSALDGEKALQLFEAAWEENAHFDLIVSDYLMPRMDGLELIKRLRAQEALMAPDKKVKLMMVSGVEDKSKVISSFREGCEYYLVKPVSKDKIERAFALLKLTV